LNPLVLIIDSVRDGFLDDSDLVRVLPASDERVVPLLSLAALTVVVEIDI